MDRELILVLIGLTAGVVGCLIWIRVQRVLALKKQDVEHQEAKARQRAHRLRQKLETATSETEWELDQDTALAALFSDNGFEVVDRASQRLVEREAEFQEEDEPEAREQEIALQEAEDQVEGSKETKKRKADDSVLPATGSVAQASG